MEKNKIDEIIAKTLKENDIQLSPGDKLSSLMVVTIAVALEKAFKIQFELDEISNENFSSLDSMSRLVLSKF